MITEFHPYPKTKDSGIEWLGEMPKHWEVRRLKHISRLLYGNSLASEDRHDGTVPVYGSNGQIGFHSSANTNAPCIIVGRKGSFGKINYCTEPIFAIDTTFFIDDRSTFTDLRWLFYLLGWLRLDEISKDSAVPGLDRGDTYKRIAVIPPLPEQTAIVRYLDYVDRRVRRFVRAKQKLIGLLEEQKQVIIHRAVTRGLDPNVPLKPSGVEWLGEVPEHWEVRQLGRIGRFSKGSGGTKEDEVSDGVPCVRYGDLYTQHKFFIRRSKASVTRERASFYVPIQYGDILFAGSGETIDEIGKSAVNLISGLACCGGDVILFKPLVEVDAEFFGYATDCPQAAYQKSCMGRGITIMHIYASELKYMRVALPPLPEQIVIVEYLDKATADIDATITRARREVELLNEYRTRLIADVVIGKLDVREAAAQLPDETDEPELLDENNAVTDREERVAEEPEN